MDLLLTFMLPKLNPAIAAATGYLKPWLDDDVLLRLHPVPGEPGEVARLAAVVSGRRRRRRRGRRRSRPVVTPGTSPRSWHPAPFTLLAAFLTELKKKHCDRPQEFAALRGAKCHGGCWTDHAVRRFSEHVEIAGRVSRPTWP